MKKIISTLLAFVCLALNTFAQTGACNFQQFTLQCLSVLPSTTVPGKFDLRVNLSWDVEINKGNKFTYLHIWQDGAYVPYDYSKVSRPPVAANLNTALGTIVIMDPSTNPVLSGTYLPDPTYTNLLAVTSSNGILSKQLLNETTERFTVSNLLIPGVTFNVTGNYRFKADFWSSQQNAGSNIHCSMQGNSFVGNDIVDRSLLRCNNGGLVNVRIQSSLPAATGTYQLYADNTTPGVFNQVSDVKIGSEQSFSTGATVAAAGSFPYVFTAPEVTIPSQYSGKTIWLEVSLTGKSTQVYAIANSCAALPVVFAHFSVVKNKQSVAVKWQTSTELNVTGFHVQRMTNGAWTTIAFVPASNIASGSSYETTDVNTFKGLSQYRIVSVDADDKQKMSEVRSVRGDEMSTRLTIYPNPSTSGRVNIVFDNNAERDISVFDMGGRVVKQLNGEKSGNVSLDISQDGFYQIKITDRTTGESMVEKIIIKRR